MSVRMGHTQDWADGRPRPAWRLQGKSRLKDMFVGFRVPVFTKSPRKKLLSTPKFLFFDLGVRHAAAGLTPSGDLVNASPGPLLEQWVGIELWKRLQYLLVGTSAAGLAGVRGLPVCAPVASAREDRSPPLVLSVERGATESVTPGCPALGALTRVRRCRRERNHHWDGLGDGTDYVAKNDKLRGWTSRRT